MAVKLIRTVSDLYGTVINGENYEPPAHLRRERCYLIYIAEVINTYRSRLRTKPCILNQLIYADCDRCPLMSELDNVCMYDYLDMLK